MTDNEIIKALELCGSEYECHNGCPYYNNGQFKCRDLSIYRDALDLINRQKAEIEEKSNKLRDVLPIVAELKAEAITEFAERLTIHFGTYTDKDYLRVLDMVRLIDQIAKEMKGESEWGMQKLQQPQGDNEVKCKECEYLMFSDCYGECRKAYKGIVNPNDSCGKGKKRVKGEQ